MLPFGAHSLMFWKMVELHVLLIVKEELRKSQLQQSFVSTEALCQCIPDMNKRNPQRFLRAMICIVSKFTATVTTNPGDGATVSTCYNAFRSRLCEHVTITLIDTIAFTSLILLSS